MLFTDSWTKPDAFYRFLDKTGCFFNYSFFADFDNMADDDHRRKTNYHCKGGECFIRFEIDLVFDSDS